MVEAAGEAESEPVDDLNADHDPSWSWEKLESSEGLSVAYDVLELGRVFEEVRERCHKLSWDSEGGVWVGRARGGEAVVQVRCDEYTVVILWLLYRSSY